MDHLNLNRSVSKDSKAFQGVLKEVKKINLTDCSIRMKRNGN